jgi:transposase
MFDMTGMKVWIVNARHVKHVPGHKTDKKDSAWLCKLLLADFLKPSYIPPREQRELRDLTRYRKKMIESISSNKNRIDRILEDCNVKLSSVMSHTSGVVATKLIDKLIDGKQITIEDIDSVYHHRLHASREELLEACNGYVTEHHVFMLRTIRDDIAATEAVISKIDKRIKNMLAPYENVIELLKKVPGLNTKTIEDIVAEIGLDTVTEPVEV